MKKFIASFICSAVLAMAGPVSVTYESANPQTDSHGNNIGPYVLDINGHDMNAMCLDDFLQVSGTWTADLTSVDAHNLDKTYLGNSVNIGDARIPSSLIYKEEAYLFTELLKPGSDQLDIQEAAWTVMDIATGHTPSVNLATDKKVDDILINSFRSLDNFDASQYDIVSQVHPGDNAEQEFIVDPTPTPEPASCALLGGGFLLFGAAKLRRRKRSAESIAS